MADKKSGSDNPWAEMSRLNLGSKDVKTPSPDAPPAAQPKSEANIAAPIAATVSGAALSEKDKQAVEAETAEYSIDDLQELSLKELQALANEAGIDTKGMSKEELIDALAPQDVALTAENAEDEEEIVLADEEELDAEEIDGEMSIEEAMALLGEDSETEEDFAEGEFEVIEEEVVEGDVDFEQSGGN